MDELVKISEGKPCPYAESIKNLHDLLAKVIKRGTGFTYVYALRKNIAYSLQYLEFLDRCITDLKMSDVIRKLNYKAFILVGISIMEALIHYLLIKRNYYPETVWERELIAKGNEKSIGNKIIKVDSYIYKKLPSPVPKETSFNKMLDRAEKKKILGGNPNLYSRLNYLRKLRNKVHLHIIEGPTDTDWNRFIDDDMSAMAEVIHSTFTSGIFRPSNEEKAYFKYLNKYFEEEEKEALEPERVEEIEYKPEKLEIKGKVKIGKKAKKKVADFNFEHIQKMWPLVLDELKEKSKPTHAFLLYAMPVKVTDNLIEIQFEPEAKFQMEILEREDHFKKIQETLSKILSRNVNIHLTIREEEKEEIQPKKKVAKKEKISENEVVELLKAEFDAESID